MHGAYSRHILEQAAANRYRKKEEGPLPQPVPCHPTAEQSQTTQPTKEKDDVA